MDDLSLARALHVLGVVIWIGGVSMASTGWRFFWSAGQATT